MDLSFTPRRWRFATKCATFVRANLPASIRDKLAAGRHPSKDDIVAWTRILHKKGWSVPHWPVEWGGTGWSPVQLSIFNDEIQAGQRAGIARLRHQHGRAGDLHLRLAGAEGALPAAHRRSQRLVVPGLFRAGRRLGPRGPAHHRQARRRRMGDQRPEDLDDARPVRRLDFRARAHRRQREETGRHLVLPRRHEDAGHHGAPDPDDRRRPRGQRSVLRQRAHPRREHRRHRRTRAGITRNSCSATSATASRASASPRRGSPKSAGSPKSRPMATSRRSPIPRSA